MIQDSLLETKYALNTLQFQTLPTFEELYSYSEFDSRDKKGSGRKIDSLLIQNLTEFSRILKKDYGINSGFRTEMHNRRVGGVEHSAHTKGLAVDLSVRNDEDRYLVIAAALHSGFTRIGIGKTFIHIDCVPEELNKPPRIWLY